MKPLTILVDLDGVVANWSAQFDADRAWYYPHIKFDALEEFTTPTHLPQHHQEAIDWVKHRPGFYADMLPIKGAIDGVMALMASGHDVWFCSTPETRNPSCASDKIAWVTQYLGADAARRVILTHDKTLVRGDLLIDDRPDVTGAMKPTWKQVLFTQPYNLGKIIRGHTYFARALNWFDVPTIVEDFAVKVTRNRFAQGCHIREQPGDFMHEIINRSYEQNVQGRFLKGEGSILNPIGYSHQGLVIA